MRGRDGQKLDIRITPKLHSVLKALYKDLVNRDSHVQIPPNARWNVPEGQGVAGAPGNPWKSSSPIRQHELETPLTLPKLIEGKKSFKSILKTYFFLK